jgi:hypothetical protein
MGFLFQGLQLLDTCTEILTGWFESCIGLTSKKFGTFSIFSKAETLACNSSMVAWRDTYVLLSSFAVLPIELMVRRIRSGDCTTRARTRETPSVASAASAHMLS